MAPTGVIGAGEAGSHIASGQDVIIANSPGLGRLSRLVAELGQPASASTAVGTAAAGDFVVVAVPLRSENDMPVQALAGRS
jgi:predicted dinucleotide-binding enzyme